MSTTNQKKRSHEMILVGGDTLEESSSKIVSTSEIALSEPQAESSNMTIVQSPALALVEVKNVPGLLYCPNFVSREEETTLLEAIDAGEWDNSLRRRVQHFGLRYDYSSKSVDRSAHIEPLPSVCDVPVERMKGLGVFLTTPDQCIVNGACLHIFSRLAENKWRRLTF